MVSGGLHALKHQSWWSIEDLTSAMFLQRRAVQECSPFSSVKTVGRDYCIWDLSRVRRLAKNLLN